MVIFTEFEQLDLAGSGCVTFSVPAEVKAIFEKDSNSHSGIASINGTTVHFCFSTLGCDGNLKLIKGSYSDFPDIKNIIVNAVAKRLQH